MKRLKKLIRRSVVSAFLAFCLFVFITNTSLIPSVSAATSVTTTDNFIWDQTEPTVESLTTLLGDIEQRLKEIPTDAKESDLEGRRRVIWKERAELILEWRGIIERLQALRKQIDAVPEEMNGLKKTLLEEKNKPPLKVLKVPTPADFLEIQSAWDGSVRAMEELQSRVKDRLDLIASIPERLVQVKERKKIARKDAEKIAELAVKESGVLRVILLQQTENARLRGRVAEENLRLLAEEQRFEKETLAWRDQQIELARLQQLWYEQAVAIYRQALHQFQESQLRQKEAELLQKSKEADQAENPGERFLKGWEAHIALLEANIANLNKLKTDISPLIASQEKLLSAEREELKKLKTMFKNNGLNEWEVEMLQNTFRRIEMRRKALDDVIPKPMAELLARSRARMVEIDEILSGLQERMTLELAVAISGMKEDAQIRYTKKGELLLNSYRDYIKQEKQLLFEVDSDERRLGLYPKERLEVLVELKSFVLSVIFWIQDDAPINFETLKLILEEVFSPKKSNSLLNWWVQVLTKETLSTLLDALGHRLFLGGVLLLSLALPTVYFLEQRRQNSVLPLSTLLLPAYLLILGLMIGVAGLPASIGAVTKRILWHVAICSLAWNFTRLLCATSGILISQFGIPVAVSGEIFRALRLTLLAYLVCLLPWMIFKEAPFQFEALPRMGILLFELCFAVAVSRLIRPSSSLVKHALGFGRSGSKKVVSSSWLAHYWPIVSRIATLFMVAIILLDAMGYRFSAQQLAKSGLLSLFTLFSLIGLHHLILALVGRIIYRRRRHVTVTSTGQEYTASRLELFGQIRKALRFFIILLGFVLLADYWDLDESIFLALGEVSLYSVVSAGGALEFITLADLTRFLLGLTFLIWFVQHLPNIFEIVVFPRIKMDAGARYAMVTMSRYLVFLVGLFVSFSFLKLDLAKVGWLVAAISVGLGFGLQEIVANFVSGIILLIERPIRVDDIITVGGSIGKVTQINIRSTTILTADLQELLIPNRDLITKEVSNGSLGNQNSRLSIIIGVSYSSDVDKVMSLLINLATSQPEVLSNPPPEVLFLNHGASSLDFELRIFLPDLSMRMMMLSRMNLLINRTFREHEIEIPFPQQDIHIRSGRGENKLSLNQT